MSTWGVSAVASECLKSRLNSFPQSRHCSRKHGYSSVFVRSQPLTLVHTLARFSCEQFILAPSRIERVLLQPLPQAHDATNATNGVRSYALRPSMGFACSAHEISVSIFLM